MNKEQLLKKINDTKELGDDFFNEYHDLVGDLEPNVYDTLPIETDVDKFFKQIKEHQL